MAYEDWLEVEELLNELSQYEYKQVKPKIERIKELFKPFMEAEHRRNYRLENGLKSSVDRDIVREVSHAKGTLGGISTMNKRAYDEVGYHDKVTNDLLHALELLEGDEQLAEYTKELRSTRQMRREAKDFHALTQPMMSFINRNRQAIKDFNEAVVEMQEQKKKLGNRAYKPRVITELADELEAQTDD